jgi:serine/threonine-protein kinase
VITQLASGQGFAGYRVEHVAGHGGMSLVYRATQVTLDRPVALKVISPELGADPAFRTRFERESRLLASIEHPNVIPVYEAGEADGQLFIAMRWVQGTDLRALLSGGTGLEWTRATAIVAQVADALDAAHARGLVHRDVKPANILIEPRDGREHAYLSDFGVARSADSEQLTRTGHWVGTVDYAAPEQIQGGSADARSDVYSLGCVLYHALTGSVPFPRESDPAKLWAHINDPPPSARKLQPGLSPELDVVIARALAKRPFERYASAGELGRAAVAAAASDAATTEPDAEGVQARRRRRFAAGGVAAVVLGAGAVAGVLALTSDDTPKPPAKRVVAPPVREPKIRHISLGAHVAPGDVAADSSNSYVVDRRTGKVLVVDPTANEVFGSVKLGKGTNAITVDDWVEHRLWATNPKRNLVSEINTERGTIVGGHPFHVAGGPTKASTGSDAVVVSGAREDRIELRTIDRKRRRQIGPTFTMDGLTSDVAAGFRIFVLDPSPPRIVSVDYQLGDKGDFKLPLPEADDTLSGPLAAEMALGSKDDAIAWVVVDWKNAVEVVRVDLREDKLVGKPIQLGRGEAWDIATDNGTAWVANKAIGTVTRIDEKTGRIVGPPIQVGDIQGAIAAKDGIVWVSGARNLVRIDP